MKRAVILAIETSCDETATAVVDSGKKILSNIISSQVDLHRKFGGVVPEIASRRHLEVINLLVDAALKDAGMDMPEIDAIAVSQGPGLVGALLVGVSTAKALSFALDRPLISINHLEGHIYANFLEENEPKFPLISLIVSGGHTSLIWMKGHGFLESIGSTRDDAAGEAFDKVARALDLGYPGGPIIDELSSLGDPRAINFPRAMMGEEDRFAFSFSGLKSAVINYLTRERRKGASPDVNDLAASFQAAVVDVLVDKTMAAAHEKKVHQVLLAGGVAANRRLRQTMREKLSEIDVELLCPPPILCTDNAAMIASAAYYRYICNDFASLDLNAVPNLGLKS